MVGPVTARASFERCEDRFGEWFSAARALTVASTQADCESRR
jgi:hypothetical protein